MVLDLIGTWLGLGLGGFGTNSLGTGLDKNVCPLETSIQILSLTDLLIPADGQIKVDNFFGLGEKLGEKLEC